jgi:hypothetical protein
MMCVKSSNFTPTVSDRGPPNRRPTTRGRKAAATRRVNRARLLAEARDLSNSELQQLTRGTTPGKAMPDHAWAAWRERSRRQRAEWASRPTPASPPAWVETAKTIFDLQDYTVKVKSPVKIDPTRWSDTYGGDWELDQSTGESEVDAVMPGSSPEDAYQSTVGNLEGTFPDTTDTWELIGKPVKRTTSEKYVDEKKSKYYS